MLARASLSFLWCYPPLALPPQPPLRSRFRSRCHGLTEQGERVDDNLVTWTCQGVFPERDESLFQRRI